MENMLEFSYVFLPHTKFKFPCMQGNFSYVFLFHTKLIFPCMQGDLKKSNTKEYICWMQVKIYISDKPF
jgi:hypothetical protein